ncbi:MAG: hypothetical protein BGN92_08770 [Sphingobacteriales bacterium 41-5]|nr:MAG: hypothetical protein ABS67_02140 [Niabella sp. SCN 42-15]OJU25919.1 MAG: hypothetical protein BGN92_08770 [Sphingobacteriales bacterium 41-5]
MRVFGEKRDAAGPDPDEVSLLLMRNSLRKPKLLQALKITVKCQALLLASNDVKVVSDAA